MNDYKIIKQVKDTAAKCFIETMNYLGLVKNGVLCLEAANQPIQEGMFTTEETEEKSAPVDKPVENVVSLSEETENGYLFEIPTMGKKTARFYIPDNVTPKDIDYIKLYIANMLPVFLDNLKAEMGEEQ